MALEKVLSFADAKAGIINGTTVNVFGYRVSLTAVTSEPEVEKLYNLGKASPKALAPQKYAGTLRLSFIPVSLYNVFNWFFPNNEPTPVDIYIEYGPSKVVITQFLPDSITVKGEQGGLITVDVSGKFASIDTNPSTSMQSPSA
jgi:hypothetical protein